jgi:hypothetical protein
MIVLVSRLWILSLVLNFGLMFRLLRTHKVCPCTPKRSGVPHIVREIEAHTPIFRGTLTPGRTQAQYVAAWVIAHSMKRRMESSVTATCTSTLAGP